MQSNIDVNINFGGSANNFQSLIDNTNKLSATIGQLEQAVNDYTTKATGSNAKAAKSVADYTGSYKTLSAELAKNRAALKDELDALTKLRGVTGVVSGEVDKQEQAVRELEKTVRSQTSALNQYNKTLGITSAQSKKAQTSAQSLTKTFNSLGAVLGISFGAYGAFRGIVEAIKVMADFELAQKKLRSILGETANGMKEIEQSAINVGSASIFGAKGVTELQVELAKMGFTKNQIIDMQEAVVNLATATQEDLASSAEVVANIIRTYNLTASDATRITDIMGKAFNDSALDLSNFRESIKYVAPIAAQANFTFEDTVALLEQLSNAGIKGSLAGTGLTNIISRLGDANSKFTKTLGRTVNGFDEFLAALIELKSKGADLGDTFELVDRRAAAAFTILLQGVDTVEEFKQKLLDSNGVMKNQTAVQLESLTNQWKLMRNAIEATILSIDEGNGVFSTVLKGWIGQVTDLLESITGVKEKLAKEEISKQVSLGFELGLGNAYEKQIEDVGKKFAKAMSLDQLANKQATSPFTTFLAKQTKEEAKKAWQDYYDALGEVSNRNSSQINAIVDKQLEGIRGGKGSKNYYENLVNTIAKLGAANDVLSKQGKEQSAAFKINELELAALNKEYEDYLKKKDLTLEQGEAYKKQLKEEIDLLRLQKEAAIASVKFWNEGLNEKIKSSQVAYEYDLLILEKEEQNAEKKALKKEILFKNYITSVEDMYKEFEINVTKLENDNAENYRKLLEKDQEDLSKDLKEETDIIIKELDDRTKRISENAKSASKIAKDNPMLSILFPQLFKNAVDDTGAGVEALKDNTDAIIEFADIAKTQITSLVDSWVSGLDRIVDARQRMVEEAQDALTTEIALAEAGFASNVTLKRKELEESKRLRREAIEDQQKAQKVQLAIDSATQLSSLATATADYFKSTAKIPIIGVLLAIAAATTMFATFAKFKNLAKEQSAVKYEKGGWIYGKRHSQGGVPIEAEGGEFMINRKSALKHKSLIEAINKDDSVSINRLHINGIKNGVLSAKVSLDDSEDLKAIRKSLESNGKRVEYHDGYRIEYNGSTITKIKNA